MESPGARSLARSELGRTPRGGRVGGASTAAGHLLPEDGLDVGQILKAGCVCIAALPHPNERDAQKVARPGMQV